MKGLLVRLVFKRRGLALDVLPAVAYVGLLLYAGMIPMAALPAPGFMPADKFWHLLAFGGLAGLLFRALRHFDAAVPRANRRAMLGASACGALLEGLQSLTPFRSAELGDFVADTLGALIAFWGIAWLSRAHALVALPPRSESA